jgi:uncharacterized membrane protein YdbT with pleckstrin-like domain
MTPELTLKPSQLINIVWVFLGGLSLSIAHSTELYLIGVFALIPIYKIVDYATWSFEVYDDCIIENRGVFSVTTRELYFHRVKSVLVDRPFWMRILGVGNVVVRTSDQFSPIFIVYGIEDVEEFVECFQDVVKDRRAAMGMQEYEIFQM